MKLIKLTHHTMGESIYVDFDKVLAMIECERYTRITCSNSHITVEETPEEIIKLIENAKEI